ncbi:hypothetical protein V5O48_009050 [Marasmius crinis-equi]|uniref:Uncharacterized protein n=1 Tax=Marasmius crinis-equi TaxID=585013 RepID=A0ABR3FCD3_9AGAR
MPEYEAAAKPPVDEQGLPFATAANGKSSANPAETRFSSQMDPIRTTLANTRHQKSQIHRENLDKYTREKAADGMRLNRPSCEPAVPIRDKWDILETRCIQSSMRPGTHREELPDLSTLDYSSSPTRPPTPMPTWSDSDDEEGFEQSQARSAVSDLMESVGHFFEFGPDAVDSDDENCEIPEARLDEDPEDTPQTESIYLGPAAKKRREQVNTDDDWFPWASRLVRVNCLYFGYFDAPTTFGVLNTSVGPIFLASSHQRGSKRTLHNVQPSMENKRSQPSRRHASRDSSRRFASICQVLVARCHSEPNQEERGQDEGLNVQVPDTYLALERKDVLCSVNVQHVCVRHKCKVVQLAVVRQERHDTGLRRGQVAHQGKPHDVVLNTVQMRDAKFVQLFRIRPEILPVTETIEESARREWAATRRTTEAAELILGETIDPVMAESAAGPVSPSSSSKSGATSTADARAIDVNTHSSAASYSSSSLAGI